MRIDPDKCISDQACIPYCPVGAIKKGDQSVYIDQDMCVECGDCTRAEVCPVDAIFSEAHPWPRSVREAFSNPLAEHKETRVPGRGTEEMKTNDVRGLFNKDIIGVACELGRPGVSTNFRDVEIVTMALAPAGMKFAEGNPVTTNMIDKTTGKMNPDLYNERAMSAIVEGEVPIEKLAAVIRAAKEASTKIDTVFSFEFISRPEDDRTLAMVKILDQEGLKYYPNGKFNLGLGRPLVP